MKIHSSEDSDKTLIMSVWHSGLINAGAAQVASISIGGQTLNNTVHKNT